MKMKVSSNGYLTFGPKTLANQTGTEIADHFRDPKIAGLSMNLDPSDSKARVRLTYNEKMDVAVLTSLLSPLIYR